MLSYRFILFLFFFFFNDTATTEIYTLSLHDALPISFSNDDYAKVNEASKASLSILGESESVPRHLVSVRKDLPEPDRKSTRLNSSHANISYAVFCLKKKKKKNTKKNNKQTKVTELTR